MSVFDLFRTFATHTVLRSSRRQEPSQRRSRRKLTVKPLYVWSIRMRLQVARKLRDLALFDFIVL
jgi:hypothetical protein